MSGHLPPSLRALAAPFVAADVLAPADLYAVGLVAPLLGEHDPTALLGLCFAVRAPRHGHVGAPIATLHATALDAATRLGGAAARALPWPDPEAWVAAVAARPAVDATLEAEERTVVWWEGLLQTRRYWDYQDRLARALVRHARAAPIAGPPDARSATLARLFAGAAPEQRLGAIAALAGHLCVVAGGPGTGKTYTVKRTLALLHHEAVAAGAPPPRVALAAPTGKAAVRMAQAIGEQLDAAFTDDERAWLRALQPSTVHRLLGFDPANSTRFRHGPDRPLPYDVVVVDEASMVDLPMMTRLVEAVDPRARLVLLGDRDQLASVEAGSVLADLTPHRHTCLGPAATARLRAVAPAALDGFVAAATPADLPGDRPGHVAARDDAPVRDSVIRYDRPFRFGESSGIGKVAYAVASGAPERLAAAVDWLTGAPGPHGLPFDDLAWIPDEGTSLAPATIARLAGAWAPAVQAARAWRPGDDLDPVVAACDHARVLCAHRRGPRGVEGLNLAIRRALAARLRADLAAPAAPGVPLLVTENRYDLGLMNGDVGVAVQGERGPIVAFATAGGVRALAAARLPAVEPVFAMTIHKSQGSQFANALLVLPAAVTPLLTRELVYTGITRASGSVAIVGRREVLLAGLRRRVERSGRLAERIATYTEASGG